VKFQSGNARRGGKVEREGWGGGEGADTRDEDTGWIRLNRKVELCVVCIVAWERSRITGGEELLRI